MPDWLLWTSVCCIWAWFVAGIIYEFSSGLSTFRRSRRRAVNPLNSSLSIKSPTRTSGVWRCLLIASALLTAGVLSGVFWRFTLAYAGVTLVLIGVAGEYLWEEKSPPWMLRLYKWSARLLIFGLGVEMVEAWHKEEENAKLKMTVAMTERDAAEAKDRANKSQIELERMRARRIIPLKQRETFLDALKGSPKGEVFVCFASPDRDTPLLAEQVKKLLAEAGFQVNPTVAQVRFGLSELSPPWYIGIVCDIESPPPHAIWIQRALKQIGSPGTGNQPPKSFTEFRPGMVAVFVGSKE